MSKSNVAQPIVAELSFLRSHTGIEDEQILPEHVLKIQAEAYRIHPYPYICNYTFLWPRIVRSPAYSQLLKLGSEHKGAIFVDVGCTCESCITQISVHVSETFTVPFVPGDVFHSALLKPVAPFYASPDTSIPDISSLTLLTPLLGHVSAVHAAGLFHLFNEKQEQLARILASLLSSEQGLFIFNIHVIKPEKGIQKMTWT
ncbi:hypothetical protein OBBRIDRAFT_814840 [Obba rivulosa]|uniref:Uncharacterized protein n=1 Tax=Obba rivulosa TaxID=1052685 RepID=A0A8E2DHL8_9APHY|nr:hypothetical protein OBBRIDRAFT_814840 [Obba rivulosa]